MHREASRSESSAPAKASPAPALPYLRTENGPGTVEELLKTVYGHPTRIPKSKERQLRVAVGLLSFIPSDWEKVIRMRYGVGTRPHLFREIDETMGLHSHGVMSNIREERALRRLRDVADRVPEMKLLELAEMRFFKMDYGSLKPSIPKQRLLRHLMDSNGFRFIFVESKRIRPDKLVDGLLNGLIPIDREIVKMVFGIGQEKATAKEIGIRFNMERDIATQIGETMHLLEREVQDMNRQINLFTGFMRIKWP